MCFIYGRLNWSYDNDDHLSYSRYLFLSLAPWSPQTSIDNLKLNQSRKITPIESAAAPAAAASAAPAAAAKAAAPAEEELADTITVGAYLLRDKDASYLLQMSGDSMKEEGILDGDMVIFERSHDYRAGDIIVSIGPDGYRLSHFSTKRDTLPLNVIGVVTGSFRKYK